MVLDKIISTVRKPLLDILFPPPKRVRKVRSLTQSELNSLPPAKPCPQDFIRASFAYQNETVRRIVQAAKYDGSRHAARIMGALLYDELMSLCAEKRIIEQEIALVPVPLHHTRYQDRGFNQCNRIIDAICKQDKQQNFTKQSALKKKHATPAQAGLPRSKRKDNVTDCFTLQDQIDITNTSVIIIDDVITTGATLQAARSALQKANPKKVLALTFAH